MRFSETAGKFDFPEETWYSIGNLIKKIKNQNVKCKIADSRQAGRFFKTIREAAPNF